MDPERDNPEGEERPGWLPEKFSDGEALAASYSELEKRFHEVTQQNSAMEQNFSTLSEQLEELQTSQQAAQQPQQEQYGIEQLRESFENDPLQTVAFLAQQAAASQLAEYKQQFEKEYQPAQDSQREILANWAEQQATSRHDDWADFKAQIDEEVRTNPVFKSIDALANPTIAGQVLDQAYAVVKQRAIANGEVQPEAQSARELKLAAQGITGGQAGRPDPVQSNEQAWDRIRNAGGGSYNDLMSPRP